MTKQALLCHDSLAFVLWKNLVVFGTADEHKN
jgi:hypothetical protein